MAKAKKLKRRLPQVKLPCGWVVRASKPTKEEMAMDSDSKVDDWYIYIDDADGWFVDAIYVQARSIPKIIKLFQDMADNSESLQE